MTTDCRNIVTFYLLKTVTLLSSSSSTFTMAVAFFLVSFLLSALGVDAQCVTAGFVPCLAPGASAPIPPPALMPASAGGFWGPIQGVASDPIQFGGDPGSDKRDLSGLAEAYVSFEKRQNSLCCRPSPVECLHTQDGVPFCYVRFKEHCVPPSSIRLIISARPRKPHGYFSPMGRLPF